MQDKIIIYSAAAVIVLCVYILILGVSVACVALGGAPSTCGM